MRDYKTSIGGFMLALGAMMIQIQDPAWVSSLGASLLAVGGLIAGTQASDKKKGDE